MEIAESEEFPRPFTIYPGAVDKRLLSWSEVNHKEAHGAPTRSHSEVIETEVHVLASSSALEFTIIPLGPGT